MTLALSPTRRLLASALLCLSVPAAAAITATPRIIGGQDAPDHPWVAGLHLFDGSLYSAYPFCGGSLIAPRWVLTAAHCVTDGNGIPDRTPAEVVVRLDSPDLYSGTTFIPPSHEVDGIFVHPDYLPGARNDVALVRLATPVSITPIPLIDADHLDLLNLHYATSDLVQALGWGVYDDPSFDPDKASEGNQADTLQSVRLDFIPWANSQCRNAYGGQPNTVLCARETAAASTEPDDTGDVTPDDPYGEDTCFGDSGGPLLLPALTLMGGSTVADSWLVGATSSGNGSCDSNLSPGIYSSVFAFARWLEQTTGANGAGIVDLGGELTAAQPFTTRTGSVATTAVITNQSLSTTAQGLDVTFTPTSPDLSITITNDGPFVCDPSLRCTLASLLAGQSATVELELQGSFASDAIEGVQLDIDANQHDYRAPDNSVRELITFTDSPALSLDLTRGPVSEDSATVNVRVANLTAAAASSPSLWYALDPVVSHRLTDPSGTTVSCVSDSGGYRCALAALSGLTEREYRLTVTGSGRVQVDAILDDPASIQGGADSLSLTIGGRWDDLGEKSDGGAVVIWSLALLYLRRSSLRRYWSRWSPSVRGAR